MKNDIQWIEMDWFDWLIFLKQRSCLSTKLKTTCFNLHKVTNNFCSQKQNSILFSHDQNNTFTILVYKHQPNDHLSWLFWTINSIQSSSLREKKKDDNKSTFPKRSNTSQQNSFSKICPLISWALCLAPKRQTLILC